MRQPSRRRRNAALLSLLTVLVVLLAAGPSFARTTTAQRHQVPPTAKRQFDTAHRFDVQAAAEPDEPGQGEGESGQETLEARLQYSEARTSPGVQVPAGAIDAAERAAARMPVAGGRWSEVTRLAYDNDAPGFADPVWSNYGAGWGLVSGRMTALDTDGRWIYAGAADGGVWVSKDHGRHWTATFQSKQTLAVGAVFVNPRDHSLWVGSGEANTASDNYTGHGVYRSIDHGATYGRVGGQELDNAVVFRITASSRYVYAATSHGLWRRGSHANRSSPWQLVLKPDPNPTNSPYLTSFITDVAIRPGSGGNAVVAVLGWRAGSDYNGFYVSSHAGAPGSFSRVAAAGLDNADIGRTSLSYSKNGARLVAVIQSVESFNEGPPAPAQSTVLKGVYQSASGDPAGPWTLIAEAAKLAASGSALTFPSTYEPGVQAWYNQYVLVDPRDSAHVYLGLEEIFETSDGGTTWTAIGPYWNFGLPCYVAGGPSNCPFTTHPDQHGAAIAADGTFYAGNDGGVWSRPSALRDVIRWNNHNRNLHSLQYYFAEPGRSKRGGGVAIWGGLQDNGTSLLLPGSSTMVSPFGGDGGDVLVDPRDADRAAVEYVDMSIAVTTNGGRSSGAPGSNSFRLISPACEWNPTLQPCDPSPRFITPFEHDPKSIDHWITGGEFVWETTKGFGTVCEGSTCDWKIVYDTGAGHQITAVETVGATSYVGWCGPCNPTDDTDVGFVRGLATNYGGSWHAITAPNLPNRFVNALTADPNDPAHVYAVFNGFSRRWIPGGGVGHVFESRDGGATWTDISGNLPDIAGDDLVLWKGRLALATDNYVYIASARRPTRWARLGTNLPHASTNDLALYPSGNTLLAATHGRGLWRIALP
jgi:hypothetical protein